METSHFGTLTIATDPNGLFLLGKTSAGNRIIQELLRAEFAGVRLRGTLTAKSNADWLSVDADGQVTLDIRVLLTTDDGALVFVTLDGRADWSEGLGRGAIYSRVRFESGDERYAWVNRLQLVSKGAVGEGGAVAHEVYELR